MTPSRFGPICECPTLGSSTPTNSHLIGSRSGQPGHLPDCWRTRAAAASFGSGERNSDNQIRRLVAGQLRRRLGLTTTNPVDVRVESGRRVGRTTAEPAIGGTPSQVLPDT